MDPTTLKTLGNTHYSQKQFAQALENYTLASKLDPTSMTYKLNMAAVYYEQKKFETCIATCLEAIEIGRENRADFKLIAKAFTRIANSYKQLGELANAKVFYDKSLSEHRTVETKGLVAEVEKLLREQERTSYIDVSKAEEEKELGNSMFKGGDWAGALKHYSEAIRRNPTDPKLYSNRAACYTKLAAFDLGLKDCDECIRLDPVFVKGHLRKGKILQGMSAHTKAQSSYEKALELDPSNVEALEGYKLCMKQISLNPEENRKKAMGDPEIQAILGDPAMRLILEQMQTDPRALQEHLKNPEVAGKIQKLLESGLIAIR